MADRLEIIHGIAGRAAACESGGEVRLYEAYSRSPRVSLTFDGPVPARHCSRKRWGSLSSIRVRLFLLLLPPSSFPLPPPPPPPASLPLLPFAAARLLYIFVILTIVGIREPLVPRGRCARAGIIFSQEIRRRTWKVTNKKIINNMYRKKKMYTKSRGKGPDIINSFQSRGVVGQ